MTALCFRQLVPGVGQQLRRGDQLPPVRHRHHEAHPLLLRGRLPRPRHPRRRRRLVELRGHQAVRRGGGGRDSGQGGGGDAEQGGE